MVEEEEEGQEILPFYYCCFLKLLLFQDESLQSRWASPVWA